VDDIRQCKLCRMDALQLSPMDSLQLSRMDSLQLSRIVSLQLCKESHAAVVGDKQRNVEEDEKVGGR
jgi:hypothetical protein